MKLLLLFALFISLWSCSRNEAEDNFDEDYVLIEFASKLEEEYQHPTPASAEQSESEDPEHLHHHQQDGDTYE